MQISSAIWLTLTTYLLIGFFWILSKRIDKDIEKEKIERDQKLKKMFSDLG